MTIHADVLRSACRAQVSIGPLKVFNQKVCVVAEDSAQPEAVWRLELLRVLRGVRVERRNGRTESESVVAATIADSALGWCDRPGAPALRNEPIGWTIHAQDAVAERNESDGRDCSARKFDLVDFSDWVRPHDTINLKSNG